MAICVDVEGVVGRLSGSGIKASSGRRQELHRVLVLLHLADVAPHDVPDADYNFK